VSGVRLAPIPGPRVVVELAERVTGLLGTAEELLTDAAGLLDRIVHRDVDADPAEAVRDWPDIGTRRPTVPPDICVGRVSS
jgi:hypothetical protein